MFPTTRWTAIEAAGRGDGAARDEFATRYREPVLRYVQARGFSGQNAEDLCQEVFLRVLRTDLLARADRDKGSFGGLLRTVVLRTVQDHLRRRRAPELPLEQEPPAADKDPDFDRLWALHLAGRAMGRLREAGSPYHEVLKGQLEGRPQDRQKLWLARKKLIALVRDEVARTCSSPEELEEELGYLSGYLRPKEQS